MPGSWRQEANAWLSTHLGIITAAKLEQLGCSPRNVLKMVERGELAPMFAGVFRSSQWPCGREQVLGAVCARNRAAIIGFTTAGQLWSMRRMADPLIRVLIPHGRSPEMSGVVVHRCRRIDPVDIVERPDGIRLTSPPRTLFDSADMIGADAAASVLEQLLNEHRMTFGTITDTVQRLYHPRRPGSTTILSVLGSRPAWRAALQSDLEVRVLAEIARQHLPVPLTQYRVSLGAADAIAIDFAWPECKLAVEVDHPTWHAGAADSHADKRRDRKLAALGWTSTRITDVDVHTGLPEAVADIGRILFRLQRGAA
jgi:hypothetical protein